MSKDYHRLLRRALRFNTMLVTYFASFSVVHLAFLRQTMQALEKPEPVSVRPWISGLRSTGECAFRAALADGAKEGDVVELRPMVDKGEPKAARRTRDGRRSSKLDGGARQGRPGWELVREIEEGGRDRRGSCGLWYATER